MEANLKKPRPAKEREADLEEQAVLQRIAAGLEAGRAPRKMDLKPDEEKYVRSFQLLTLKPELAFYNQGEAALKKPIPASLTALSPNALAAPTAFELELAELSEEDRAVFAADLGITGSKRDEIIQQIFANMNRIVFLTVGEDECRAWPLNKGADATEGAARFTPTWPSDSCGQK